MIETQTFNQRIRDLQRKLRDKLETGGETSLILQELAEVRAEQAQQADIAEMQKINADRGLLRDKASAIMARVDAQGAAIDSFLSERDALCEKLSPLIAKAQELAKWQTATREGPALVYAGFNDVTQWHQEIRRIPASYFPPGFCCPTLAMASGTSDHRDVAIQAAQYITWGFSLLSQLEKGIMPSSAGQAADDLLDGDYTQTTDDAFTEVGAVPEAPVEVDTIPDTTSDLEAVPGPSQQVSGCPICQHPQREQIDRDIAGGKSLRAVAAEYGIASKNRVDTHKRGHMS